MLRLLATMATELASAILPFHLTSKYICLLREAGEKLIFTEGLRCSQTICATCSILLGVSWLAFQYFATRLTLLTQL